jgi:collagen type IV alpha-3-binding protein
LLISFLSFKEIEKRKKIEEQYKELSKGKKPAIIIAGPDFEEGPHSNIKEEQFFDAIDSTLDTLELEEERVFFFTFFKVVSIY